MSCNCTNGCHRCGQQVIREVFNCPGSQRIVRHEHVVRHQHDIIHEFDVIHEHEYNTRDVVREREVVRHNDCRTHTPDYCEDSCGTRPSRPRLRPWGGRRW
ncbi:MAG: hypothetical protein FWC92_06000 [Defluviitaleaceae bacterium]|nr:hypothetical protein [Defluviitaleaceae bacterium]